MSANVLLRVPGAAVSVDPTPPTRPRHPLRKPRPLALAAPLPAAFEALFRCGQAATSRCIEGFGSSLTRRSGVSRCAKGACGAVGEAGGAARKSLGRRRSRAGMSRFDDVGAPRRSPSGSGSPRFETKTKDLLAAQQNHNSSAATGMQRRFAVREHVIDVREPAPHLALQHRFAVRRRQALAVNDAYATKAAGTRLAQEPAERFVRLMRRQAMQIELGLNDPASPPQPGEHIGAEPGPEKRLLAFDLLTDVPRVRRRFVSIFRSVKSVAFIQQCLFRSRRRLWPSYAGPFCRGRTRDVREALA